MTIIHCWPKHWLEAAAKAGFAQYKGDGRWDFINDTMRNMLAEFATEITKERMNMTREEALARLIVLQHDNDHEYAHTGADDVLVALLESLGYWDVVAEYHKIKKWYA